MPGPAPSRLPTPGVARVAGTARSLHARNRLLTLAGWSVAGALGVSLLGVVGVRLWSGASWWWVVPSALAGVTLLSTGAFVWSRRWSLAHAAGEVDRANDTEGALRTALEIRDNDGEPAFIAMARARGESVAAKANAARAVPPRRIDGWWWALGAAGACLAAGLLVPQADFSRTPRRPDPSPLVQRAAEQITTAQTEAEAVDESALPEPEAWSRARAELEALEEELRRGDAAEDAPARTAAALDQTAEELDRQAELAAREEQELRDRAASFEPAEPSRAAELSQRLADALARNDMLQAQEAARAIDRAAESMSEAELRELSDALEDLASTLDPSTLDPSTPTPDAADEPAIDPADTPDPTTDPATPPATPPGQPTTPPTTPPQPDQPQPEQPQGDPNAEQPGEQPSDQPSQQPGEQPSGQQPTEQPTDQPSDQPSDQPGDQPGDQPREQPGDQPGQQPGNQGTQPRSVPDALREQAEQLREPPRPDAQPQPQRQPDPNQPADPNQPPDQPQPGEQPQPGQQPQPGEQPQPGQQPQPGEQPQPGQQPQPGEQTQPGQQPQPGQPPQGEPQPGQGQPQPGQPQGQPSPGPVERAVQDMQRRQQARQQNQQVAESLRDRARGLIDPDQQRPDATGAGNQDSPVARRPITDNPANFEPVDATRGSPAGDDPGRVVGEWFDPDRTELPPGERSAAAGEMRQAARRARDAVENQQVPRRYRDLVQRVFERVDRRADEVGSPAGSVAPQGRDANP